MDARKRKSKGGGGVQPSKETKPKKKQNQKIKKGKNSFFGDLSCLKMLLLFDLALMFYFVFGYYTSPITALPYNGWEDMSLSGKFETNNRLTNGIKLVLIACHKLCFSQIDNLKTKPLL